MKYSIKHDIEEISPGEAKKLLEHTESRKLKNRSLRENRINQYASIMKAGNWELNGETIQVAKNGALINGQHRLMAVVKSGETIPFLVVRDLPDSAMPTIDIGSARQVRDFLEMRGIGEGYATTIAASIGIIKNFKDGHYAEMKERLTPQEALEFLEKNRSFLSYVRREGFHDPAVLKTVMPNSLLIAMYYLFRKIDTAAAEEFFDKLLTGAKLGAKSPVLQLRMQLHAINTGQRRKGRLYRRPVLYYMVSAFDAFLHGRTVDGTFKYTAKSEVVLPKRRGG